MNERQVHKYVQRFLEATECAILEKSPSHFKVKLSPAADRALTNRPYYWSFVDRTGADPETMSMLFVTDKAKYDAAEAAAQEQLASSPATGNGGADSSTGMVPVAGSAPAPISSGLTPAAEAAIGRSFGFVHGAMNTVRMPREDLHFGSRKLDQLFDASSASGSYVYLFQEPERKHALPYDSTPYTAWLGVNLKIEFACDRKRDEFHSIGVSLASGQVVERFHDRLLSYKLTPKLPPNVHITKNGVSLSKAMSMIEQAIERKLKQQDYSWAAAASERLDEELGRIQHYYEPLIETAIEENKAAIAEQFEKRQAEIRWQYEPRVTASAINCGIFHLAGID
ncbi:conserved hypothetical protein [Paenibacillus curdlanolyticus YK9]|uniref:Uncharacterized protein n=1 Tax=Paenibacillus curdlanolyticus YK9 TaxID=717606 RepID=E0ICU3_9BACL|nr:YqhG family protein [Paenibacillus curdlanolyticus]EFM09979.1 conserved hypothetical protein [Paenibacillus curdlanolyticus YK9]